MRPPTAAQIVESWRACIERAIRLGEADAAYRLARVFVRRCRELGLVRYDADGARALRSHRGTS